MKTNIKYIVFTVFMFYAGVVTAQQNPKKRAIQAQGIEQEIQKFIIANRGSYDLTPERINNLKQHIANSKSDNALLEQMLVRAKDLELRKLYFKENPEDLGVYQIKSMEEIRYICDNGGIEDGYTDDYEFETDQITGLDYTGFSCDNPYTLTPITPSTTVNDFTEPVTLVNDNTGVSGGFDPVLYGFSIEVPRVNSGTTAIKLNSNSGDNEMTKMSKTFTVDNNIISFSYSFIANYRDPAAYDASYFTAKLYKTSDNSLIEEFCLQADATNTAAFDGYLTPSLIQYVYTGWQCQTLSLQGVGYGTEVRLEFTVNDSGSPGYYGTVYIDDICDNGGECQPRYGKLILDVNEIRCDPLPIQVCGVYQLPFTTNTEPVITGTLDDLELNIYESDGTTLVTTLSSPTILGDNNFCFEVQDTDLGSPLQDEYEFEAVAEYTILGYTYTLSDFSSNLDFSECDCTGISDDLVITTDVTSPTNDSQEAHLTITAYNTVNNGATALYHAGTEVLLLEDFESLYGSTGHYYIEGCTNDFVARPAPVQETAQQVEGNNAIDLVEKYPGANFKVYPNPAQNVITVETVQDVAVTKVSLYSIDGKLIFYTQPDSADGKYIMDISSVSKGICVMSVETSDGRVTSAKVVKN